MNSDDATRLVRESAHVRVRSGAVGCEGHVMAEGTVFAFSPSPVIGVQASDGTQSWWSINLPIDVIEESQ